jgi:hypothetical protein
VDIIYESEDICAHEFDVKVELARNYTMSNGLSIIVLEIM